MLLRSWLHRQPMHTSGLQVYTVLLILLKSRWSDRSQTGLDQTGLTDKRTDPESVMATEVDISGIDIYSIDIDDQWSRPTKWQVVIG